MRDCSVLDFCKVGHIYLHNRQLFVYQSLYQNTHFTFKISQLYYNTPLHKLCTCKSLIDKDLLSSKMFVAILRASSVVNLCRKTLQNALQCIYDVDALLFHTAYTQIHTEYMYMHAYTPHVHENKTYMYIHIHTTIHLCVRLEVFVCICVYVLADVVYICACRCVCVCVHIRMQPVSIIVGKAQLI